MNHRLVIAGLVLLCVGVPVVAEAEVCQNHRLELDYNEVEILDPPLPGYDGCGLFPKIRGTLNGRFTSCISFADIIPSDLLWGDGNYDYVATKWDDVIETREGDLFLEERSIIKLGAPDEILFQAGLLEVTGGTGAYEGATGTLALYQKWPNRLDLLEMRGSICTP